MARRPRSPMRPHHHAAISYLPPELAEEMHSRKHERARRIGFLETPFAAPGTVDGGWGLANNVKGE